MKNPRRPDSLSIQVDRSGSACACVFGRCSFVVCLILSLLPTFVVAQQLNIRSYGVQDGLPQSQPLALFQDHDGRLWVVTYAGITSFNGHDWKTYSRRQGIPVTRGTCLGQDSLGTMFAGFEFEGLWRLHQDHWRKESDLGLPGSTVNHLASDDYGNLWIGAGNGLFKWHQGKVTDENSRMGQWAGTSVKFVLTQGDELWISTSDGLLHLTSEAANQMSPEIASFVGIDGDGRVIAATNERLYVDVNGEILPVKYPISSVKIEKGAIDVGGIVWLGTRNHGLLGWDGLRWHNVTRDSGMSSNHVNTLIADRGGNIWIGTYDTLDRFSPGPFQVFSTAEGLPHAFTRSLFLDRNDQLWVGTRNGVAKWDGQHFELVPLSGFEDVNIYGQAQDEQGQMYLATSRGLILFNKGEPRLIDQNAGLPDHFLQSVYVDRYQRVWLGGLGLYLWQAGSIETVISSSQLAGSVVTMLHDRDDRLWVGTSRGPLVINQDLEIREWFDQVPATIWSLDEDDQGRIWLATNGLGLACVDGDQVDFFDKDSGLLDDYFWQVLCHGNEVWAAHNYGISRRQDEVWKHYGLADGLADLEGTATACIQDAQGHLWFGSSRGLTRFASDLSRLKHQPPKVQIDGLRHSQGALMANEQVPRHLNQITAHYSGIQLSQDITYRYRLLGLSTDWSEPTSSLKVTYASLAPGQYEFQVMALTDQPSQSEVAGFAFVITPALWEQWPFKLVVTALLVAAFFAYLRWRLKAIQIRRDELEHEVAVRTNSLRRTNSELIQLQTRLVEIAHHEGLAEAAREVLHVVGNAMTSLRVTLDSLRTSMAHTREKRILQGLQDKTAQQQLDGVQRVIEIRQSRLAKTEGELDDLQSSVDDLDKLLQDQQRRVQPAVVHEPFDLVADLRHLVEIEIRQLGEFEGQIQLIANEAEIQVNLPRVPLIRVMREVLRNARTAMANLTPKHAQLEIDIQCVEDRVQIEVRDNGCGLNETQLARAFEYGYSQDESGIGAGLHHSANMVQSLGGSIELLSEGVDKGACCRIVLPVTAI